MRRLEQQDRTIQLQEARSNGRRFAESVSDLEAEALDAQRHDYFADWTDVEKERFKSEQSAMWSLIPEKFRAKAEKLAGGN